MKLEEKIDASRALQHEVCSVAHGSAECYPCEKLMMQSLRVPSHLPMEATATVREIKSASIYCVEHSQFLNRFNFLCLCL